ncbi:MAG TPA: EAL domain-containing protein [Candidatus Rubrimentiphilum sp.]|nr:EAL domain-containing protein [Candidatus Rubrimentiphilum sp.]
MKGLKLGTVFDEVSFGIASLGPDGTILDANAAFRDVYAQNSATLFSDHESEFGAMFRGELGSFEFEQHALTGGQESWTQCTVSVVKDDNAEPEFAICMFRDITALKQNERRMLHEMTHDPLTGLPNRLLFESKLREQRAETPDTEAASFAVLLVDIDHFREINEGFGHDAGDFVITQVGHRLASAVGPHEVVARIGTDQFAILVHSLKELEHLEVTARRLFSALALPMTAGFRTLYVSASIGIAESSALHQRAEDLMRDAQIAVRYAKASGGSRTAIFDSQMQARAQKHLQLSTDLRGGLERGEFFLVYQPIVDLENGNITGCEALLRWNHPTQGLLPPAEFIPLADEIGLSTEIGRAVSRLACRQLAAWKDEHNLKVRMNINVAWPDLLEAEFERSLVTVTREFGIEPLQLTLEITENIVLTTGDRATRLVESLRQQGFGICIDDFGTGYSSLHYLQKFKIDAMKIDRSFVSGSNGDVASEPIVRALMTLADGFGVKVVAEGIETQQQCDAIRNAGCRYGQGFFFAKPMTPEALAEKYF